MLFTVWSFWSFTLTILSTMYFSTRSSTHYSMAIRTLLTPFLLILLMVHDFRLLYWFFNISRLFPIFCLLFKTFWNFFKLFIYFSIYFSFTIYFSLISPNAFRLFSILIPEFSQLFQTLLLTYPWLFPTFSDSSQDLSILFSESSELYPSLFQLFQTLPFTYLWHFWNLFCFSLIDFIQHRALLIELCINACLWKN